MTARAGRAASPKTRPRMPRSAGTTGPVDRSQHRKAASGGRPSGRGQEDGATGAVQRGAHGKGRGTKLTPSGAQQVRALPTEGPTVARALERVSTDYRPRHRGELRRRRGGPSGRYPPRLGPTRGSQRMLRFLWKWRPGHSWRSEEMRDDGRGDHRCVRCPTRSHLSGLGLTFPLPASPCGSGSCTSAVRRGPLSRVSSIVSPTRFTPICSIPSFARPDSGRLRLGHGA